MENQEIIYYCQQGDPYCQSPKCRCNTVRPDNIEDQPNQGQTLPIDSVSDCHHSWWWKLKNTIIGTICIKCRYGCR